MPAIFLLAKAFYIILGDGLRPRRIHNDVGHFENTVPRQERARRNKKICDQEQRRFPSASHPSIMHSVDGDFYKPSVISLLSNQNAKAFDIP